MFGIERATGLETKTVASCRGFTIAVGAPRELLRRRTGVGTYHS